jgi:hypothetical protein
MRAPVRAAVHRREQPGTHRSCKGLALSVNQKPKSRIDATRRGETLWSEPDREPRLTTPAGG